MKKKVKVNFVGYEPYMIEHNFVLNVLSKHYEVEISDTPDIVFYSVFNADHRKYNCIKVFVCGEPCAPDFNECDYAITSVKMICGERHYYYPFYFIDGLKRFEILNQKVEQFRFCNFIYSHTASRGGELRNQFCQQLMKYKIVDCLGKVMHNKSDERLGSRDNPNWRELKQQVLREYKFTIAFENAAVTGYTTEKVLDPLQANSIPIYYGNTDVADLVNPDAIINANDYIGRFEDLIEKIKEIDEDDELFNKMINCSKYSPSLVTDYESNLETFLINIVENGFIHDKDPYHFLDKTRISGYSLKTILYYKVLPYAAKYYTRIRNKSLKLLGKL